MALEKVVSWWLLATCQDQKLLPCWYNILSFIIVLVFGIFLWNTSGGDWEAWSWGFPGQLWLPGGCYQLQLGGPALHFSASCQATSRPQGCTQDWEILNSIEKHFQVVLADSQEAPYLEDELPEGVESVVQVSEEQAEAGRGLLFQQVLSLLHPSYRYLEAPQST